MDDFTKQFVFGVAVPLVIALLAVVRDRAADATRGLARTLRALDRPGSSAGSTSAKATDDDIPAGHRDRFAFRLPLMFGTVFALATLSVSGWTGEKWQLVIYAVAAGTVAGVFMSLTPRWWWVRGVIIAACAGACGFLLRDVFMEDDPLLAKLAPVLGTFVLAAALEPLAVRSRGPGLPLAIMLAVGTAAGLVLWSGNFSLAIPLGTFAVALGVCSAFAMWDRAFSLADGAVPVIAATLVCVVDVRWVYAVSEGGTIPWYAFALPCVAPLTAWLGVIKPLQRRTEWLRTPMIVITAAVICGAAILIAYQAQSSGDAPDGEIDYDQMYMDMMNG